jgi:hypothetical protein
MLPKHHDGHGDGQMALLKLGVSYASLHLFAHFVVFRVGMGMVCLRQWSVARRSVSIATSISSPSFGIVTGVTQSPWQVQDT